MDGDWQRVARRRDRAAWAIPSGSVSVSIRCGAPLDVKRRAEGEQPRPAPGRGGGVRMGAAVARAGQAGVGDGIER